MSLATATRARRRPGFAFEAVAPAAPDALPRMDVPLFAGIAARGPLHVPVVVEDLAQFEGRFGGPAPLVPDAARGQVVTAQLHAAVALFFAGGGRRCWVLRVAHAEPLAEASRFELPGVTALRQADDGALGAGALVLRAASPGRWADDLLVATSLEVDRALPLAVGLQALTLQAAGTADWVAGDLLRLSWPGLVAHVGVAAVQRPVPGSGLPLRLGLRAPWWVAEAGSPGGMAALPSGAALPGGLPTVERLRLTLWWCAGGSVQRLAGLGLAPGHPRHVAALPDDAALDARPDAHLGAEPEAAAQLRRRWADALAPRVPLAGQASDADTWCLPLGLGALPAAWAEARHSARAAIERDGLVPWNAALWADAGLIASPAHTLASDAEALRLLAREPRALSGLHAAWALDEVSLLAMPDAVWPGWVLQALPEPPPPPAPPPPVAPPAPGFVACTPEPQAQPGPATVAPAAAAPAWQLRLWSAGIAGRATLLAVQRLALRWVLARGDGVALLTLPPGASDTEALGHRERLLLAGLPPGADDEVPPLLGHEHAALGLAALVHGGVWRRTADGGLQRCGAEGPFAGLVARRTLARGAWIAPANEGLRGIVALDGGAAEAAVGALLDARVNVLATTPRGVLPLNADTLGPGPADDLRPLATRRLLQLLRRLALREGQAWVFEPHDSAFRRGVQRSLEALLHGLFERGAFAGRRAADAFQVVAASEALNTRASVDAGRFVVELRVAPAQPMAFVTLRLVRSGDGLSLE